MAQTTCQFIEGCPMFKYFRRTAERVYREMYCEGDYVACERRKLRVAGKAVPANLLPHGGKLWDDNSRPPEFWEA